MSDEAPTQSSFRRAEGAGPASDRGPAFTLVWDHAAGHVQVILPSMTRINFSRESKTLLWAFCNAATLLHQRDPEFLRDPLTQKQIDEMRKQWLKDGNVVIKPLDKLPPGTKLEDILAKSMGGLKL